MTMSRSTCLQICCVAIVTMTCAVFSAPTGGQPKVAKNIKCISDNFEDMECSWEVSDRPQIAQETNYTLLWAVTPSGWHQCPHSKGNTCKFIQNDGPDSFKKGLRYYVSVRGVRPNQEPSFSTIEVVNTYTIVKPKPVRELKTLDKGQGHLQLSWTHPENLSSDMMYSGLTYSVTLESADGAFKEVETREEGCRVGDLVPNTLYKVSVKVKPYRGGYWSEPSRITTTTS